MYYNALIEQIETFDSPLLMEDIPGFPESAKVAYGCNKCFVEWPEAEQASCSEDVCGGARVILSVSASSDSGTHPHWVTERAMRMCPGALVVCLLSVHGDWRESGGLTGNTPPPKHGKLSGCH